MREGILWIILGIVLYLVIVWNIYTGHHTYAGHAMSLLVAIRGPLFHPIIWMLISFGAYTAWSSKHPQLLDQEFRLSFLIGVCSLLAVGITSQLAGTDSKERFAELRAEVDAGAEWAKWDANDPNYSGRGYQVVPGELKGGEENTKMLIAFVVLILVAVVAYLVMQVHLLL